MSDIPAFDRFSLPGEIPDDAPVLGQAQDERAPGEPSLDWQARGLRHPAGRGWEPEGAASDADLDARLAQWDVQLRPPPGRGSQAGARNGRWAGDPPAPPAPSEPELAAAAGPGQCLTPERQVRFLDHLATCGNVRVSAQRAGVSHESAYRLRRREARFAALWDAALVHARAAVASVMGDRALEGVLEEVWFRGELVGHRRRYDSRLLLAHLARLDALVAEQGAAAAQAEWFDAGLAALAGHAEPAGFAEAQGLWDEDRHSDEEDEDAAVSLPPTRREFVAWFAGEAIEGVSPKNEDRVFAKAQDEGGALYDAWAAGVAGKVDEVVGVDGPASAGGEGDPPVEFKSALCTVSHLSHPSEIRAFEGAGAEPGAAGGGSPCGRRLVRPLAGSSASRCTDLRQNGQWRGAANAAYIRPRTAKSLRE